MAKRKKAKKSSPRRRRKVGAMGGKVGQFLQMVVGGVAAQYSGKLVDKLPFVKDQSEMVKGYVKAALPIALGYGLPKVVKGTEYIGAGMIVGGGIKLVQTVVPAIGQMANFYSNKPVSKINGYQTQAGNYIAGYQTNTAGNYIAGMNFVGAAMEELNA
jgi:hypothetical protein